MPSLPDVMTPALETLAPAGQPAPAPQAANRDALVEWLLRTGDNALILGQRLSEWCGHAPALEEDIALANQALDLIGQCQLWLGLAGEIEGRGRSADDLAFLRDAGAFRNLLLVERPNGDFGHTLMRQFLFDVFHLELLEAARASSDPRIAEIAAKAWKEAAYHLERSADLVVRLGDGSAESHDRMQGALSALWSFTGEMFTDDDHDRALAAAGVMPLPSSLRPAWDRTVAQVLDEATLPHPGEVWQQGTTGMGGGKRGVHSEHLGHLLAQMQFLQRAYPGAGW
ncbi:MAG: phenylacetate-CoA oxygenase subunit PaaC [Paracoccus sp.]|nr:phenylacetate-CoA oxygenase subunit PaaC [Paracoccus sp. (in: a-proteobacteria)]